MHVSVFCSRFTEPYSSWRRRQRWTGRGRSGRPGRCPGAVVYRSDGRHRPAAAGHRVGFHASQSKRHYLEFCLYLFCPDVLGCTMWSSPLGWTESKTKTRPLTSMLFCYKDTSDKLFHFFYTSFHHTQGPEQSPVHQRETSTCGPAHAEEEPQGRLPTQQLCFGMRGSLYCYYYYY